MITLGDVSGSVYFIILLIDQMRKILMKVIWCGLATPGILSGQLW